MAKKLTKSKAKEILHDKSVHGHPLTDKQRRFFGAIAGGAKPYKAQDGLTTEEKNKITGYLQNLSGKKAPTAPSREDLQKAISKTKPLFATNTHEQAVERSRKEQLGVVEQNKEADRKLKAERAAARKTREAVIAGDENATFTFPTNETKKWKDMDWREQQYVSGKNLGSLNRGDWTDYINPLAMLGSMSEGLATSPYEARRTNSVLPYITGVGAPLLTGALAGIGTKGNTAQFVENVVNPTPISLSGNVDDFSKHLTSEQVSKGYSLMKDAEGNLILRNDGKRVGNIELFKNPDIDIEGNKWGSINVDINPSHRGKGLSKPLYDAVLEETKGRGFKGIKSVDELLQSPQQSKAIRKYFPGKYSTDENLLRNVNKTIDEDNAFAKELGQYNFTPRAKQVYLIESPKKKQDGGAIEGTMGGLTDIGFNYNGAWGGPSMQMGGNIMPAMAGANQTVPMAQLGDSVKPIPMQLAMGGSLPGAVGFTYARTAGAAPANGPYAKKTKASAQNGQEMKFYQAGLDFKPKTISQDGSEIPVDSMGYWNPDNWGNPVIIPSTDITMEGVDVPLIGISDTGDVQYMEPGEDYEFDGEYVTEYPVAKKGISVNNADAQPIKKLDQLLNFTNYNKPTKGGWLDKYN